MNKSNVKSDEIPHPFRWYVPENAQTLVIGTFPPVEKRWAYRFFYPNKRNLFWGMMAAISGIDLSENFDNAIEERKAILNKLRLGVTNMGGKIRRISDDSKDESLELIEPMPIFDILRQHPSIKRIILTSSSGKVSALAWFTKYLLANNIGHFIPKGNKPLKFQFHTGDRSIDAYILYSPSPRAANRMPPQALTEMYRNVIVNSGEKPDFTGNSGVKTP